MVIAAIITEALRIRQKTRGYASPDDDGVRIGEPYLDTVHAMSESKNQPARRRFLNFGIAAGCSCFFPGQLVAAPTAGQIDSARAQRLQDEFSGMSQGVQAWLTPRVGPASAAAIAAQSRVCFAALIGSIPDIGRDNRNQESLTEAVWLTAIAQAMQAAGLPLRDAGRLFYDLCAQEMAQSRAEDAHAKGQVMFSPAGRESLKRWAKGTQQRRYPGDWVAVAVFGDGKTFDVGYDYSECGAVKFFAAHGVAGVAPYFCLNDFTLSRSQGTGLSRSHTLGQGDALCDFRYKQDGAVTQSWESEAPRFENKTKAG